MTTVTQFMASLSGISVTGVTRAYTSPPTQINTADLPCTYPRLPTLAGTPITACGGAAMWPELNGELVLLVEPVAQERQPTNWTKVLTLIDALNTALRGATLAQSKASWTIRQEIIEGKPETYYWAIVTTVTAAG
jgi:hypothetical protein